MLMCGVSLKTEDFLYLTPVHRWVDWKLAVELWKTGSHFSLLGQSIANHLPFLPIKAHQPSAKCSHTHICSSLVGTIKENQSGISLTQCPHCYRKPQDDPSCHLQCATTTKTLLPMDEYQRKYRGRRLVGKSCETLLNNLLESKVHPS